eukprot:COSAG02_NODE_1447_length_12575_cov_8.479400_6_plen_553_part_00
MGSCPEWNLAWSTAGWAQQQHGGSSLLHVLQMLCILQLPSISSVTASHRQPPVGVASWEAPAGASVDELAAFVGGLAGRRSVARVRGLPPLPHAFEDWGGRIHICSARDKECTVETHESVGEKTLVYWAGSVRSNDDAAMRALQPAANSSTVELPQPLRSIRKTPAMLEEIGAVQRERFEKRRDASQLRYYYAGVDPHVVLSSEEVRVLQVMPFRVAAGANQSTTDIVQTLWFASCGTEAQLHYDASDNLFRQLKRFRFMSPASTVAAQLFSSFSPAQRQCRISQQFELHEGTRDDQLDCNAFATLDLEPGEALFIPAYTLHHVSTPRDTPLSVGLSTSWPSPAERLKDVILSSPVPFDPPPAQALWNAGDAAAVFVTMLTQQVVSPDLHAYRGLDGSAVVSFLRAVRARAEAGEPPLPPASDGAPRMCHDLTPIIKTWRIEEAHRQRQRDSFKAIMAHFQELMQLGVVDGEQCDTNHDNQSASGPFGPIPRLMFGRGVAEIVLAELVEFVSLWAAGEAQWHEELGSDGAVAGRFLASCVLEPLLTNRPDLE